MLPFAFNKLVIFKTKKKLPLVCKLRNVLQLLVIQNNAKNTHD